MPNSYEPKLFKKKLNQWFVSNERPLPWKGISDPYKIWVSEIILQQTRVAQGLPYYTKFIKAYPKVEDLAAAPSDEIMKMWEGLGYYSRARNLHSAAKFIHNELNDEFPTTYENIRALKGVGDYTAAAIASFAYKLPHAVVDGNVYRVLARIFGIETATDSSAGKREFAVLATSLLDTKAPNIHNQAIMDFGATHCKAQKPLCQTCPFKKKCVAHNTKNVTNLPTKKKKVSKKKRFFNYFVVSLENCVYLHKRISKDIWNNLYQFPLWESSDLIEEEDLLKSDTWTLIKNQKPSIKFKSKPYKQTLSHQYIVAVFWEINIQYPLENEHFIKVDRKKVDNFAVPKIIDCYLKDKSLYLKY